MKKKKECLEKEKKEKEVNDKEVTVVVESEKKDTTVESEKKETEREKQEEEPSIFTFKEFVIDKFYVHEKPLTKCIEILCNDLPAAYISDEIFQCMTLIVESLKYLEIFKLKALTEEEVKGIFQVKEVEINDGFPYLALFESIKEHESVVDRLGKTREVLLQLLRGLCRNLTLPIISKKNEIEDFCLQGATLIFCTAATSFRLHKVKMDNPLKLLIVDEAAQLKECESLIPLQLSGIQNAIFIGDEFQLPAFVRSQVSIATHSYV